MKRSLYEFGVLITALVLLSDQVAAIRKSSTVITTSKHHFGIGRNHDDDFANALSSPNKLPFGLNNGRDNTLPAGTEPALALLAKACRGGACSDSTPALFAKVALASAVETGLMYSLVTYAVKANTMDYSKVVTRLLQGAILFAIIFGSASFGAIIDNGLSAATKQILDPNTIPGDNDWYENLKKPSWNPP